MTGFRCANLQCAVRFIGSAQPGLPLVHAWHSAFNIDATSCQAGPLGHVMHARYVDSATFRAFKETGELQYSEFGTHLGTVRNLLNFVAGRAGFGPGGPSTYTCHGFSNVSLHCTIFKRVNGNQCQAMSMLSFRRFIAPQARNLDTRCQSPEQGSLTTQQSMYCRSRVARRCCHWQRCAREFTVLGLRL